MIVANYRETELIIKSCPRCYSDLLPDGTTCSFCGWREPRENVEQQPPSSLYRIIGLDLGQVSEPSALALIEQRNRNEGDRTRREYTCPYLRRWPLATPYPQIVREVKEFVVSLGEPLPYLMVDIVGCGRSVFDQLREASIPLSGLVGANITGGFQTTRNFAIANIPKRALASAVRSVLEGRRLLISSRLKEAQTLRKELGTFTTKVTTASNETYEELRTREDDDLVLAVALALWREETAIEYRIVSLG
jgi:hypothetical protein